MALMRVRSSAGKLGVLGIEIAAPTLVVVPRAPADAARLAGFGIRGACW